MHFAILCTAAVVLVLCTATMARVTFSALVTDIRGKTGDVVFSIWKGINYIRARVTPSNPRSDLQTAQREALADTLTMWQSVKSWAKTVWDVYASGYGKSGYNRYIEDNILHVKAGTAGSLTPFNPLYIIIAAMAATQGGAGEIDLSWTKGAAVYPTDHVDAYYRKTEALAEEYAWTYGGHADPTVEALTIAGLDTGEEYEVAFMCHTAAFAKCQQSFNKVLLAG